MIKNIILLVCTIAITNSAFSQKCVSEKDPFSNEQIYSFDFRNKTVFFKHSNNETNFEINFNYWGERSHEFNSGTEISIKLKDNNKLVLKSINKSTPKIENVTTSNGFYSGFGFGGITSFRSDKYTVYSFSFVLSGTELAQLSKSKIEIIRIPDTDEGKFVDLKAKGRTKKKINAIQKGALCISESI